ncbi:MAG: DegT/DnrJ/EryC1/StrS family aminotransferase, partial [Prosthecobacter sp.]
GAVPVFADIEPDTFTLCPESLETVLCAHAGQGVRAALAVHLYGHPADWENLRQTAAAHGVTLLEDVAQAHGAVWHERKAGTLGVAAAFSFYPTKNLAACGDAGAVVCDDPGLAEKLHLLRQYGWRERHVSAADGVNSRLDEMQAAVLRVKLPFLPESVARREKLANLYDQRLGAHKFLKTPVVREGCRHAWHQYVVRSPCRDDLMRRLEGAGIPVGVHYPIPLHLQPAFKTGVSLPNAEASAREVVSLPLHPHLAEEAVSLVCDVIESLDHAVS